VSKLIIIVTTLGLRYEDFDGDCTSLLITTVLEGHLAAIRWLDWSLLVDSSAR